MLKGFLRAGSALAMLISLSGYAALSLFGETHTHTHNHECGEESHERLTDLDKRLSHLESKVR
jgi:hypothetical protein